ncbi:MAG TPA: prepilin-type N-terminal cleavage/methylation domain-containing protein [Terriglobia bacterium]|nr:prepilin-type N-terminal cleavage/methylation domain-containing protein [Terriglobia bacterium]
MSKEKGFSLIELLIVVSIILIIAGIAIPSLMKSRQAANQASAVASERTIDTAEVTFASTYNTGYSTTLAQLGGTGVTTINNAELIDTVLASGQKSSYFFYYVSCPAVPGPNDGTMGNGACAYVSFYQASANPSAGVGKGTFYYTDPSGITRQNAIAYAGPSDSPIGN